MKSGYFHKCCLRADHLAWENAKYVDRDEEYDIFGFLEDMFEMTDKLSEEDSDFVWNIYFEQFDYYIEFLGKFDEKKKE